MGWESIALTAFLAIFGSAGIFAIFKIRPEAAALTVQTAERVIIIQKDHIEDLIKKLEDYEEDMRVASRRLSVLERDYGVLRTKFNAVLAERNSLEHENKFLRKKITELEGKVKVLESESSERKSHE